MTDRRLSIEFTLSHPQAEPEVVGELIEKLRQQAIDLGFQHVGEVFHYLNEADVLTSEYGRHFLDPDHETFRRLPMAVVYFTLALAEGDTAEIGLERSATEMVIDEMVIPSGVPEWFWSGSIKTRGLKAVSKLLHHAADLGIESYFLVAGMDVSFHRDGEGKVRADVGWVPFAEVD